MRVCETEKMKRFAHFEKNHPAVFGKFKPVEKVIKLTREFMEKYCQCVPTVNSY